MKSGPPVSLSSRLTVHTRLPVVHATSHPGHRASTPRRAAAPTWAVPYPRAARAWEARTTLLSLTPLLTVAAERRALLYHAATLQRRALPRQPPLPPSSTSTRTGTSGHRTAPPTPPRTPYVLRTSLRATSQSPPPPDDALHAVPLRPTSRHHGACSTMSFPSLHCPKSDPRAVGMHLSHFPHPLSPPVTGIGRRHRHPCASGQGSPASLFSPWATSPARSWAGQFRPKCTVVLHNFQLN
jgi:hypothetical protein